MNFWQFCERNPGLVMMLAGLLFFSVAVVGAAVSDAAKGRQCREAAHDHP